MPFNKILEDDYLKNTLSFRIRKKELKNIIFQIVYELINNAFK